jgi:crossover junction endodeoxyribonuclease RuvC
MAMIYIGIDPGKKGAYAVLTCLGESSKIEVFPWGDLQFVEKMEDVWNECRALSLEAVACVEKVSAMHGQGVTSMFSFGKSAGFIEGVLAALGIPYQLIPPQTWKKEFGLNSDKAKSIEVCKRLFPDVNLLPTEKCKKESDGMAEACLMALYARRKL